MVEELITLDDFSNLQIKFTDNLILHYIELNNLEIDEDDKYSIVMFELSFTFYNQHYTAWISSRNIDLNFSTVQGEGNSELFDSFINAIEYTHWEVISELCKQYLKVLNND